MQNEDVVPNDGLNLKASYYYDYKTLSASLIICLKYKFLEINTLDQKIFLRHTMKWHFKIRPLNKQSLQMPLSSPFHQLI